MDQDVAYMVCAELYHGGMALDLVSAAQISKSWNTAATPWLYRSLTLDFESNKSLLTSRLLQRLLTTDKERPVYRHYVQNLKITMPTTAWNSRRRLQPGVLRALARLVPLLSMLDSFTWEVPEPMPKYLLEAVDNHPKLSNRAALFTCWGLNEDRQYLENLTTTDSHSELVIDFRPRCSVTPEWLIELMSHQTQLLLRQQTLKSLTIKYNYGSTWPVVVPIGRKPEKRSPSIERFSLEYHHFIPRNGETQLHMNGRRLRRLILVDYTNPQRLLASVPMKLSQLIIRRPRWVSNALRAVSDRIQIESALCKGYGLQELELESLGISHEIIKPIVKSNGDTIRKLRLHKFEHGTLTQGYRQPVLQFKSIPPHIIHSIWSFCPHLQSLELDLTETDITRRTDASRILQTFMSLKHLQINTQLSAPAFDPANPHMGVVRVGNLARDVWSYSLETFRLTTRSVAAQDGTQLGNDGSWLVTLKFKDVEHNKWNVEVVEELAAAAVKKRRLWARVMGVPYDPPTDLGERVDWVRNLRRKVNVAGVMALMVL